jgi:hypothetical protein
MLSDPVERDRFENNTTWIGSPASDQGSMLRWQEADVTMAVRELRIAIDAASAARRRAAFVADLGEEAGILPGPPARQVAAAGTGG